MQSKATFQASGGYSPEEWEVRVNLAACYRLAVYFGMTDIIYTHITARVPGMEHHFLINPYGLLFEEVRASNLIKIDLDGNVLEETEYPINQAGYVIHSAVHGAREDVQSVVHNHTSAGVAVSAQKEGLLPISQTSLQFYGRVSYHDYEGPAQDTAECDRIVADLGENNTMILRNHGLLTAGRNIPEAFGLMVQLDKACQIQIAAQSGGELNIPSQEVLDHSAETFKNSEQRYSGAFWSALLRIIKDQLDDYAS
ncbi:MAG: class II aldolase/adducin family protein [SAR324 cluster bacterium]|nr:class II aldolase/adducin family protein [SAR324 cluster bacterium]MCZ6841912.1 class II aldolase/adducin family protein [SAR324 cluster bacterium]